MKKLFLTLVFALLTPVLVAAQNHGVNLTWTADTSAATCLSTSIPACVGSYLIFEGSAPGQESSTPLATVPQSTLIYVDNGTTMNAYLGTTRCYTMQFQEVVGTITVTSLSSSESCATFPSVPNIPSTPALSIH